MLELYLPTGRGKAFRFVFPTQEEAREWALGLSKGTLKNLAQEFSGKVIQTYDFTASVKVEPAYQCHLCDFVAKNAGGLASHVRAHERKLKEEIPAQELAPMPEESVMTCEKCGAEADVLDDRGRCIVCTKDRVMLRAAQLERDRKFDAQCRPLVNALAGERGTMGHCELGNHDGIVYAVEGVNACMGCLLEANGVEEIR